MNDSHNALTSHNYLVHPTSHFILRGCLILVAYGVVLCALSGCSSKWAMDDAQYARKYGQPYSSDKVEKSSRMLKQMVDARHVKQNQGISIGAVASDDPFTVGGELGWFYYPDSWFSVHNSLMYLAGTGEKDFFTGVDLGIRAQTPTRLAPFVGAGVYGGYSLETERAPCGCEDREVDHLLGAIYPEIGYHFWLNGTLRVTTSVKYFFSTQGREHDLWMFGVSFGGAKQAPGESEAQYPQSDGKEWVEIDEVPDFERFIGSDEEIEMVHKANVVDLNFNELSEQTRVESPFEKKNSDNTNSENTNSVQPAVEKILLEKSNEPETTHRPG